MSKSRICYLLNLDTGQRIDLPHMIPFILGRNRETMIRDPMTSRKQIVCLSDTQERKVKIKPVGQPVSGCNGLALNKDVVYTIGYKDIIEVRLGHHMYEVMFDPTMDDADDELPKPKKPKMDFHIFNTQNTKPSSSDLNGTGTWEEIDNKELLIYTSATCRGQSKIASFDIDGTIIKTKSGATFPKSPDDWTWNISDVKDQLKRVFDKDYKLVFFTNQSGVGNDLSKIKGFKNKIVNIITALNLPVQVFISLGKKMYRKPRTGMWDILANEKNDGVEVDIKNSFYVGDAAGREKNWAPKMKKDHSVADRLFAMNIGINFYTPEEYFLRQSPAPFKMPEFDPRVTKSDLKYPDITYNKLNVILMVGGPGSGKSSYVKEQILPKGYVHVTRDKLGSWQKCVKVMEEALQQNKNVVIDNTNVDKETRQRFIQAAKKFNADVRCFVLDVPFDQMRHNNKFREMTDTSHVVVSDIIIYSYRKNFQEPEFSEGYEHIIKIPFICKFEDKAHEKLYKSFLLE